MKKELICYLDGNALCIVKKDFINIQESDCIFVDLKDFEIKQFKEMTNGVKENES